MDLGQNMMNKNGLGRDLMKIKEGVVGLRAGLFTGTIFSFFVEIVYFVNGLL